LIEEAAATLAKTKLEDPVYEARQLVQEALDVTFAQIVSQPDRAIEGEMVARVRKWAKLRADGQPLAYLSKRRGFYKHDFIVEPGVLVPRPETELVVETALRRLEDNLEPVGLIADLGCGTGCIGLSILAEFGAAHLNAVDISDTACSVTERNARALNLDDRCSIERTKVMSWSPNHRFDLVVANPPYIADNDPRVEPGVARFEPARALYAGEDGLELVREWSEWAIGHLEPGGLFVCEFGADQGRDVQAIFAGLGFASVQVERDLAGFDRVISGLRPR
jgi:release factor glutamine methyltransferase